MPNHLSSRRADSGFTLVELLVVIVLLGIAGTIFLTTVVGATQVDTRTRARADVQQEITLSMQRLTKQVRVAAPLVSVADHQLVADVYPTAAGTVRHRFTYTVATGQLTEQLQVFSPATSNTASSTTSRVLARDLQVTTPSFAALDRAGVATTLPLKVASINVRLTGKAKDGKALPVTTDVFLRNYQG